MQAQGESGPARLPRRRWIFSVRKLGPATVIRIVDNRTMRVYRDVPVEEFLAYARRSTDLRAFFFGDAAR